MDLIDSKYVNLISGRLQKFKTVKSGLYNFRCPICGDSQKNKNKTRGYLYSVKNNLNYKCHNCGISISFNNFLKQIDATLHKSYSMEKFKENKTGKNFVSSEPKFEFKEPVFKKKFKLDLPKASENQESKTYLESRNIDPDKFYYTPKFKTWVNSLKKTFADTVYDEPRIIIPIVYDNKLVGIQGRSIGSSKVKYITIMLDEEAPKIYGLDKIQKDSTVYVTEGPFDSTFLCNSIAMCGADANIDNWGISDAVWVYDNEPRNREILSRISRVIENGQKVVIWPSSINEKDINDMVNAGHDVNNLIKLNTYSGLEAKLKFTVWKKI
jgi:predicted RNA-binding Zn-ribbon protein involved in translation (DUF1610 family)